MIDRRELLLANTWEVHADRHDLVGAWATDRTVGLFLEPLRDAGWLQRATHYWVDDAPVTRVPLELDALICTWRDQTAAFFAGAEKDPIWKFWLSMRPTEAMTALTFTGDAVTGDLREALARLVAAWSKALEGTPLQASIGSLTAWGAEYDRPVPHRESRWSLGAIAYYLGRAWHEADPERAAVLHAIERAPLPAGITRSTEGDLVRVTFDCDLTDASSVAAARARGERWLTPLVPTRIAPGWNEHGDRLVEIVDRHDLFPFTFFDSRNATGYKTMIADPDTDAIDESLWQVLVAIAAAGQTPDGTRVDAVRVIVPVRDDALRLADRARADGIDLVAYPDEHSFWQIVGAYAASRNARGMMSR